MNKPGELEATDSARELDVEPSHPGFGAPTVVPIDSLRPANSPRLSGEDDEHVKTLAATERPLPPILVHRRTMRVIDGMHRLRAAKLNGLEEMAVHFVDGDGEDDIFILAVQMNIAHGLPLSTADRSVAAERIVRTHPHWSDRAIATAAGIAASTVAAIRRRATARSQRLNTRVGRDGRVRPLSTAEGRAKAGEVIAARPDASLREIAAASGISVNTARDVRERMRNGKAPVLPERRPGPSTADAEPLPDNPAAILSALQRDPALKFNDQGRELLKLLNVRLIRVTDWSGYLDAIPAHCVPAVATLANLSARAWKSFAEEVDRRNISAALPGTAPPRP